MLARSFHRIVLQIFFSAFRILLEVRFARPVLFVVRVQGAGALVSSSFRLNLISAAAEKYGNFWRKKANNKRRVIIFKMNIDMPSDNSATITR
jgi:hypothetical protein